MAVSRHVSHYHYSHYHYFFITAPFIFNPGTFLCLWYLSQNMKGPINKYFHTILLRADLLQNELEFLLFLAPEMPLASSFLDVIITVISLPRQEFLPLFSFLSLLSPSFLSSPLGRCLNSLKWWHTCIWKIIQSYYAATFFFFL